MPAQVPVDLLHWILSLLPIVVLLIFLLVLRWSAPEAGIVSVITAAGVALLVLRTPLDTLTIAGAKGVWDAVFILYVVWPALLLYQYAARAGAFEALRIGLGRFSQNELFLVLAFGWVFVSFLQGITGFGTPIAMVAPLLFALGVRPIYAVAIPVIGHAWANMFGTLSVAWLATQQVITIADPVQTATQTALLLWLPEFGAGLIIAWFYGRGAAVREALPMILIISLLRGAIQLGLVGSTPTLSNFTAVTVGFAALLPLARWPRYTRPTTLPPSPIMQKRPSSDERPSMSLPMALLPYAALTITAVVALVPEPVTQVLSTLRVGFNFPETTTGYGLARPAGVPYAPFAVLTHPGTFLLVAAVITRLVYGARGLYAQRREPRSVAAALNNDAVPSSLAIIAFLVLSKIMDHSGQTQILALGIAAVMPPMAYAFLASWLGVLGAFMTSSNTASNVLFAPVQQTISGALSLPESSIIAAQGAGAAVGNAVAPANIVLGTGPVGILGQEGAVLRKTLAWSALMTFLVGGAVVLLIVSGSPSGG